jgi:hypothetical protein
VTDFDELIQQATSAEDAEPAIRALVDGGPAALRRVLEAANAQAGRHLPALYQVIRRSTYPEAVPILLPHADAANNQLARSVFLALSGSNEPDATGFVLDRLADRRELPTTRAAAAEALYGSTNPAAVKLLREVIEEQRTDPDNPEWPTLLVNAVTALATTNDHSGAKALYALLRSEHETARALAVSAFRIVLDEDTLRELHAAFDDPSTEVRRAAVDPVFLIGSPAAAELLLRQAENDDDHEVRYNSTIRFGDIMGLALGGPEDLPFAREEWQGTGPELDRDVCYRFGDPITLDNLLEELADEATRREELAEELRIVTGLDVPSIYVQHGLASVQRAVGELPFTAGRVQKWGHPQTMPRL